MFYIFIFHFLWAQGTPQNSVRTQDVSQCVARLFQERALPSEWQMTLGSGKKAKQAFVLPLSPDLSQGVYFFSEGKVQFCRLPQNLKASPLKLPGSFFLQRVEANSYAGASLQLLSSQQMKQPLPLTETEMKCDPATAGQEPLSPAIQKKIADWLKQNLLELNQQVLGKKTSLTGALQSCKLEGPLGDAIYKIAEDYENSPASSGKKRPARSGTQ